MEKIGEKLFEKNHPLTKKPKKVRQTCYRVWGRKSRRKERERDDQGRGLIDAAVGGGSFETEVRWQSLRKN